MMTMNLRPLGCFSFLLSSLIALPANAEASAAPAAAPAGPELTDVEQARQRFAQGTKLYKDGDFDAALVQFERAYALKPNYKVLYNIGQTYFQLRQYVEARNAMQRYVREGGTQIDPEREAAVVKDLTDLEKRIANVTITVNVDGATVLVDGKKVGSTPLSDPIAVSEGQRSVSVEAPNRGVLQRLLQVAGGDTPTLVLTFQAMPVAAAAPSKSAAQVKPHLGVGFWSTAIGAVALGAGAGVTGYFALQARGDNRDQQKQLGVTAKQLEDSNRRAKTFALSTDILVGAAIACAGVATVVWATTPSSRSQVGLRVGPGGASVLGSF